jgi:hypothetical protein
MDNKNLNKLLFRKKVYRVYICMYIISVMVLQIYFTRVVHR